MGSRAFYALLAGQAAAMLGLEMGRPFLPALLGELGVAGAADLVRWTGLAQGAAFAVSLLAVPLWARVGDARSRRAMLLRACLGLAASLALLAQARSVWAVIAAKIVQGALAGVAPAVLAVAAERAARTERIAWVQTAAAAGALAAPLVGAALLGVVGARGLYAIGALVAAAAGCVMWLCVPENAAAERTPSPPRSALILPGGLAAWIFFWRSLEDPLLAIFVREFVSPASWAWVTGAALAATRAVSLVSGPLWGRWADRRGAARALQTALVGAGLFTGLQAVAWTPASLVAVRAGLGVFLPALRSALYAAAAARLGEGRRGEAIAYVSSGARLGNMLGNLGAGVLVAVAGMPGLLAGAGLGVGAAALRVRRLGSGDA